MSSAKPQAPAPTPPPAPVPSVTPAAKPAQPPAPVPVVVQAPPPAPAPVPPPPQVAKPTPAPVPVVPTVQPAPVVVAPAPQTAPAPVQAAPVAVSPPPPPAAHPAAINVSISAPGLAASVPSSPTLAPVSQVQRDGHSADAKHRHGVDEFIQDRDAHDTTVDQRIEAVVSHEVVKPSLTEVEQTAVVSDVETEHYHTTVQNISDQQVMPEERTYNVKNVTERVFDHGDGRPIDLGPQFQDERIVKETRHEQTVLPTVVGTHRHEHIHERIQPIIQREILQPSVVYTTVPIHDVHHEPVRYHATTSLPSISLAEYQRQGGALGGHQPLHGEKRHGDAREFGEPLGDIVREW